MICPKCGTDAGEAKFCPECGEKIFVPEENAEVSESLIKATEAIESSATNNEKTIDSEVETIVEEKESNGSKESELKTPLQEARPIDEESAVASLVEPKKKGKKRIIAAIAIILALILGAGAAYFLFFNKQTDKKEDEEKQHTIYVKENSVYYMNPNEEEPVLITETFFKERDDVDISDIASLNLFEFANKDSIIFYAQKVDIEDLSFALYCKKLNKPEEEPLKLAENVITYSVSDDGNSIIYLDSDDNLYHHNLSEREKILSDIDNFWISNDCLSIAYLAKDGGLYYQPIDGDKDKIDSDVKSVEDISEDLKTVYYIKDDALYLKKADTDKVKIDSDIEDVVNIFENGEIYYTKKNDSKATKTLLDYITDKEGQAETDKSAYESMYYVNTTDDLELILRHNVRKALKEIKCEYESFSLYCYKDDKTDLINSAYAETYDNSENMLIIKSFDNVNIKKLSLADVVNSVDKEIGWRKIQKSSMRYTYTYNEVKNCKFFEEFEKTINGAYETDATAYFVKDGKTLELDVNSGSNFLIKDNSTLYYLSDKDEEKEMANIYEIKIVEGTVSSNKKYDEEISTKETFTIDDIGLIYFKDAKDETADMYVDKQLIEYDVGLFNVLSNGTILYYTDYDKETQIGTAYLYSNGDKTKISEEAYHADEDANGNILFYKDFSKKSGKGDLYIFKDGECTRVDYDVSWKYNVSSLDKYRNCFTWSSIYKLVFGEIETDEEE